jgi:ubiquitin-protein ligase
MQLAQLIGLKSSSPNHRPPAGFSPPNATTANHLSSLIASLQVLEHPQLDAVALPIEANLFCWHANLRCQEGPLAGVVLHCVLDFTDLYPSEGPQIRVFHALPHPNVSARPAALG